MKFFIINKRKSFLLFLFRNVIGCFFLTSLLSCSVRERESFFFKNPSSIAEVFRAAKNNNKGVILISNMTGCAMCEFFEVDLIKNTSYANQIYKEYVIGRIDHNVLGNASLARILNNGHFPVFLFFDQHERIKGIKMGAPKPEEVLKIIKKIKEGETIFDEKFYIGDSIKISAMEKIEGYLNNLIKAQIQWEDCIANNRVPSRCLIELLEESANSIQSFYVNYLKSKYYQAINDSSLSENYARIATRLTDRVSEVLNKQLYPEIAFILQRPLESGQINSKIGVKNIEVDIGNIVEGETKTVLLKFKNLDTQVLKVNSVTPSCNCTVVGEIKKELMPNELAEISIQYKPNTVGRFSNIIELDFEIKDLNLYYLIKGSVVKPSSSN